MIVRRLREDEGAKLNAVQSIAFSFSSDLDDVSPIKSEVLGAFLDDGETITSAIYPNNYMSNFCGEFLPCVGIGGVASLPEHRRGGGVRAIFNEIFRLAPERGWATSYLYPFSYNYYRQFGYERVMMRKRYTFSSEALQKFGRDTNCVLYQGQPDVLEDIKTVYREFAKKFNIIFDRGDNFRNISDKPHKSMSYTYVHYTKAGKPDAYATMRKNNDEFDIKELAYTSSSSLSGIISFLRMFEGQADSFAISNQPSDSELDYMFGDYIDFSSRLESGGMARVVLVETLLNKNIYPEESGKFSLKVNDFLDYNKGIFDVEYAGGKAEVKKRSSDDGDYDIACDIPPLSRIMLGEDNFNLDLLTYISGVDVQNETGAVQFLKAFPKRRMCLYDWF